jgi:hypothetical protein
VKRGVLRVIHPGRVGFRCPGCKETHVIPVEPGGGSCWTFNGDYDRPTFSPSILVRWFEPSDDPAEFDDTAEDKQLVCHSFVRDGQIEFLTDCTHALAGKTVPLGPVP